jgi:hypothetical protein
MSNLYCDPTYLRYIYDGLNSGKINKENVSALPSSLVGIYEEALPPERNLRERSKFLEFFGILALLKKEVSTSFIAEILNGWTEIDVIEYINLYSKWFNSPVHGKYQLYQERIKIFILSKYSNDDIYKAIVRIVSVISNNKSNKEIHEHRAEFLAKYLFILSNNNIIKVEDIFSKIFSESFINIQFEFDPYGEWLLNNLEQSFKYADYKNVNNTDILFKTWSKSAKRTHLQKNEAYSKFINQGKSEKLIKLFGIYSDYKILFEELIYAIKSALQAGHIKAIRDIGSEILETFPDNKETFSWNKITGLNEVVLLNICYDLFVKNEDYSFINRYGTFNINNLFKKWNDEFLNYKLPTFFDQILKNNSELEKSSFYYQIYIQNKKQIPKIKLDKEITHPFFKYQYEVINYNYNLSKIFSGNLFELYYKLSNTEKKDVLFLIFNNQDKEILNLERKIFDDFFNSLIKSIKEEAINKELTTEEAFLEKDHQVRREMLSLTVYAKILVKIDFISARSIMKKVISMSNEIKNGGIKGQAVIEVQKTVKGINKKLEEIANKAYIPYVPLGGLSYGQYEPDNFLDLSENSWNENKKSKAYQFLIKCENKIGSIVDQDLKDKVFLRLLGLYLNHHKKRKALDTFRKITTTKLRLNGLQKLCNYLIENNTKKINGLLKYCIINTEKKEVIKYIFNHLIDIQQKDYNRFLKDYISLTNELVIYKNETHIEQVTNINPIVLNENKTYPPLFTLLHKKCSESEIRLLKSELPPFYKLHFDKNNNTIREIFEYNNFENNSKVLFNKLLLKIKEDDFGSFKNTEHLNYNKFHLCQIIHHILKHTQKPYLYIDYLEKITDNKLFYFCLESIIYNNKIAESKSNLDSIGTYQYRKVLLSERLSSLLTLNKM